MDTRGNLLVFGSYDARLHPRVGVLRDGLAAHGWIVSELNAPLGASTADKVAAAGSPSAAATLGVRALRSWAGLVRSASRVPKPDVVLVGYMGHVDVHLARVLFPRAIVVLDHLVGLADTALDRELAGGSTLRALQRVDRGALRAADVVVVDTELQAETIPGYLREKVVVAEVGADAAWYKAAGEGLAPAGKTRLRVVFFGLFTPLQGAPTIGRAISLLRDEEIEFTLIGGGQDHVETMRLVGEDPHVDWVDWIDASDLPRVVAGHDVCLGIFGTGPKTQRVVPTKVYQGLAAGRAVVTAATPAVVPLGEGVVTVPPGDPAALAEVLRVLARDPQRLGAAQEEAVKVSWRFTPTRTTELLDERLRIMNQNRHTEDPPLTINAWFRWDVIERVLNEGEFEDVLEIGPGEGAMACRLAEGRRYTGVELSGRTRAVTQARLASRGSSAKVVGSLDELDSDAQFDLVCAFEVLEHIEDDRAALALWSRRVRPGGTLLLSTPADPSRMGPHDVIAGHFRRYSAEQLIELAEAAGLVDVRVTHVGYPLGYALEGVRNLIARRRLASGAANATSPDSIADLTERSSSIMQPPDRTGWATRLAARPGVWTQRRRPGSGTGLVLQARAPG